ncbi:MAG: NAD(P)H-dependent oxidoreductase subunit E [Anaerolineales bacterium]|nr:NAD(P)H-dependent oxidoreductase subunit E [Anaerolineales bacterium]
MRKNNPRDNPFAEETIDLKHLEKILDEFKGQKGAIIPVLQRAQYVYGYLPKEVLQAISRKTRVPLTRLYGVATFYAQFRLARRGRHIIRVCDGTACHVRGAPQSIEAIGKAFQIEPGGTTPDYKYTLEIVYCIGSCGLAPMAVVNEKVHANIEPDKIVDELKKLD